MPGSIVIRRVSPPISSIFTITLRSIDMGRRSAHSTATTAPSAISSRPKSSTAAALRAGTDRRAREAAPRSAESSTNVGLDTSSGFAPSPAAIRGQTPFCRIRDRRAAGRTFPGCSVSRQFSAERERFVFGAGRDELRTRHWDGLTRRRAVSSSTASPRCAATSPAVIADFPFIGLGEVASQRVQIHADLAGGFGIEQLCEPCRHQRRPGRLPCRRSPCLGCPVD